MANAISKAIFVPPALLGNVCCIYDIGDTGVYNKKRICICSSAIDDLLFVDGAIGIQ